MYVAEGLREDFNRAIMMCDDCNIPYGNISSVTINYRLKRVLGRCIHSYDGNKIEISSRLLENVPENIVDTLIHEILHTCGGCQNHGKLWKSYGERIFRTFGIEIKRCANEEITEKFRGNATEHKYAFECEKCGEILYRDRYSKFVANPHNFSHTNCGGNFKRIK